MDGLGWESVSPRLNLWHIDKEDCPGCLSSCVPSDFLGFLISIRKLIGWGSFVIILFPIRNRSGANGLRVNVNPVLSDRGQHVWGFKMGLSSWGSLCFRYTSQNASDSVGSWLIHSQCSPCKMTGDRWLLSGSPNHKYLFLSLESNYHTTTTTSSSSSVTTLGIELRNLWMLRSTTDLHP